MQRSGDKPTAIRKAVAAVLVCLTAAACGAAQDAALSSAAESIDRQARSAKGAFVTELKVQQGRPFDQVEQSLRAVLTENSAAGIRAVVEQERDGAEWRAVLLYEAQRPYSRGFSNDELNVAGCVEFRVLVATLDLRSARPVDCPAVVADRFDATVQISF